MTPLVRIASLAALTALLVGLAAPPTAGGERTPVAALLPPCPPAAPEPGAGLATPPAILDPFADPRACRAEPSHAEPAGTGRRPVPRPGYHHLGATTAAAGWSGIVGRLTVRDTGVRAGSYDFVATRFLARQARAGDGGLAWLEVGWADTGWSGDGTPRVYAFDSETMSWTFFDEYPLRDGDRVWVHLLSEAGTWHAWLWWGGRWRLLAAPELPASGPARLEQYVEVHQDRPGPVITGGGGAMAEPSWGRITVPPVRVDDVRVRPAPDGPLRSWDPARVPTVVPPPASATGYCLDWHIQHNAWSAGDCVATVQG